MSFSSAFRVAVLAAALVLTGAAAIQASDDGRLNRVEHLGGDAVYCSDDFGVLLLDVTGQVLFTVPGSVLDTAPSDAPANVRLASGWGSHSPVDLWLLTNGNLLLVGQDEHGKSYAFEWSGCTGATTADGAASGSSANAGTSTSTSSAGGASTTGQPGPSGPSGAPGPGPSLPNNIWMEDGKCYTSVPGPHVDLLLVVEVPCP